MKNLRRFGILILSAFVFYACSDDDDSPGLDNQDKEARVSVKLVDAPGDYDAVYVDVEDVRIKYSGEVEGNVDGEISLDDVEDEVYNLLELTGGVSATLADDDEVPVGEISQIRLVLGSDNSVVVDGQTYPLQTPSAQQSGLKVQINQNLEAGETYAFTLDFDVEKSIVEKGNGEYLLKPVIRGSLDIETGAISGTVIGLVAGTQTLITATHQETQEEISTYTDAESKFVLKGLPEGTYTITLEVASELGLEPIVLTDIEVEAGSTTNIGEIEFL